jgi:single-strand DNA-binding protein
MKNITSAGNLTKDAETRQTQGGASVTGFSVAVNDRRTRETIFFDCSYWGKGGEAVAPYLNKGTSIVANGEFGTREYNGKTYVTCNVNSLQLMGGRSNQGDDGYNKPHDGYNKPQEQARAPRDLDDEIPF